MLEEKPKSNETENDTAAVCGAEFFPEKEENNTGFTQPDYLVRFCLTWGSAWLVRFCLTWGRALLVRFCLTWGRALLVRSCLTWGRSSDSCW